MIELNKYITCIETVPTLGQINGVKMTVTTKEYSDLFRYCDDIDMFAWDRPINDTENHKGTCDHRTDYCDKTCYNVKLYRMYPNMSVRDDRCETIWQKMTPEEIRSSFYSWLSKRKKQTKRVRACTRGEGIKDISDIYRIKEMALEAPDSIIWLPTRAWRNTLLKSLIEIELMPLPNVAVNASLDPSNTKDEWQSLIDSNWNIMFFGDDDMIEDPVYKQRMFLCPKTHKKLSGHCSVCKAGCFSQKTINRTQIVHLSEH